MANLTSCPDCHHNVSRSAARCPNCGRARNASMVGVKILMILLGVIVWVGWTQSTLNPPNSLQRRFEPLTRSADKALETIERNKR